MPSLLVNTRQTLLSGHPFSGGSLTLSGNEITDALRAVNTQGDGLSNDSSMGIWPAATNLNDNGNATTNTTGVTDHSSTTTRVTSGVVKFGTTAFSVISGNAAANEGPSQLVNGALAATQYTVSAWAWLVSGAATVQVALDDTVGGHQAGSAVVLTATPQRITVTATTGIAGINIASYVETSVQQVGTWRIGGWQVETGARATPYIQTDGGDATRAAARVQLPVKGLFTSTQGWIAIRIRYGWGSVPANATVFSWADSANERIELVYITNQWVGLKRTGGVGGNAAAAVNTPAVGDLDTLVLAWTGGTLGLSRAGLAFVSVANTSIPTTTATLMDLGQSTQAAGRFQSSDDFWFATGSGTLTNSDAAMINAFGSADPPPKSFPGQCTSFWSAVNGTFLRRSM